MTLSLDFDAVRSALDVTLSPERLPDGVIIITAAAREAEAEVLRRVPDLETRPASERRRGEVAYVLLCAAGLAPALPVLVRRQVGDVAIQRQPVDYAALAAGLRARAEAQLAPLVYATPALAAAGLIPAIFARAEARNSIRTEGASGTH